jgi:hypothetical protein
MGFLAAKRLPTERAATVFSILFILVFLRAMIPASYFADDQGVESLDSCCPL